MTENTSTGRQDNSKASWLSRLAMDQSKTIRGATNFMEQSRRVYEMSPLLMAVDYADLEKRVIAAYAANEDIGGVVIIDSLYTGYTEVHMGTIADQATWEPRLTCGKCGFRSATTDMFMAHCDSAHKVITNKA